MRARMQRHGVTLRPHLKTAKSTDVARLASAAESGPVTVSTLREAEYFFEQGFDDHLLRGRDRAGKAPTRGCACRARCVATIVTDSADVAGAIASFARTAHCAVKVLIEIDSGDGRAGVLPGSRRSSRSRTLWVLARTSSFSA